MYKNEIKKEYQNIYKSITNIDNELVNIKIAMHTLEKLGINVNNLYKQLDNVGIEFYKFKTKNIEKFKSLKNE